MQSTDVASAGSARSPYVVVDEDGAEVGVVLDYGQYLALLDWLARRGCCRELSAYWRRAMEAYVPPSRAIRAK